MHTSVSGVADYLAQNDGHAIQLAREAVKDLGKATNRTEVRLCPPLNPVLRGYRLINR